jgi:hypothetical protein
VFYNLKTLLVIWTIYSPDLTFSSGATLCNQNNEGSVWGGINKKAGEAIRLLKDSTTLTHGQIGTYIGNDGKVYPTICIGTQEWLACNLNETKYQNGDWITGFDGGVYTPISNVA